MQHQLETNAIKVTDESREWARLIRKLRWTGLEDQAERLETIVRTPPAEQQSSVSFGPFSTD